MWYVAGISMWLRAMRKLWHSAHRLCACSSGAMAVELGLVAPVVLLIMLGAYDASRMIDAQMALQSAARIGTSAALVRPPSNGDLSGVRDAVEDALAYVSAGFAGSDAPTVSTALQCECSNGNVIACTASCPNGEILESYVEVTVSQRHHLLLQLPGLPSRIGLRAVSLVRLQ